MGTCLRLVVPNAGLSAAPPGINNLFIRADGPNSRLGFVGEPAK